MITFKDSIDNNLIPIKIMTIQFPKEMIEDCYMYNAMDAPSEIKLLLLEEVNNALDKLILDGENDNLKKESIKQILDRIEIKYK